MKLTNEFLFPIEKSCKNETGFYIRPKEKYDIILNNDNSNENLIYLLKNTMEKFVSKLEVHQILPEGFAPEVQVAACYLEINNQLLLLQRAQGKLEAGKWGVARR